MATRFAHVKEGMMEPTVTEDTQPYHKARSRQVVGLDDQHEACDFRRTREWELLVL